MSGQIRNTSDVGYVVKAIRNEHGLSQVELSASLGVTQRYLSELERGLPKILDDGYLAVLNKLGIQLQFARVSE